MKFMMGMVLYNPSKEEIKKIIKTYSSMENFVLYDNSDIL